MEKQIIKPMIDKVQEVNQLFSASDLPSTVDSRMDYFFYLLSALFLISWQRVLSRFKTLIDFFYMKKRKIYRRVYMRVYAVFGLEILDEKLS